MVEVLDALRVEERAGVDLGELAVQELQKQVDENAVLKQKIAKLSDDHSAKLEELGEALRTQKDQMHSLEHENAEKVRWQEGSVS